MQTHVLHLKTQVIYNQKTLYNFLGDTALHIAARSKDKEMLMLLAKHNLDFSKKNNQE